MILVALLAGFGVFVACYETSRRLQKQVSPDPAVVEKVSAVVAAQHRWSWPLFVTIVTAYVCWRIGYPRAAKPFINVVAVVLLAAVMVRIVASWVLSIRAVGDQPQVRQNLLKAFGLELVGVLAAAAVTRFL